MFFFPQWLMGSLAHTVRRKMKILGCYFRHRSHEMPLYSLTSEVEYRMEQRRYSLHYKFIYLFIYLFISSILSNTFGAVHM